MAELPQRRSLRLPGYDYSQAGAYFVTICVENRIPLFGMVVEGKMHQSEAGNMIEHTWLELPKYQKGIKIDAYQVMPDHFHGIVWLEPETDSKATTQSLADVVQRFKSFTTRLYGKGVREANWQRYDGRLWQRSFYDHVIRNDQDLEDVRQYVINNPQKWQQDRK